MDENKEEKKEQRLTVIQRWKLKQAIKGLRKMTIMYKKKIAEVKAQMMNVKEEERKELIKMKEEVIEAILGLGDVFDLRDDKTGEIIDKKYLEQFKLDELVDDFLESGINDLDNFINGRSENERD